MIVTINCNTTPNEMHHIAVALQRIAVANGYVVPVQELTVGVDVTQQQAEAAVAVRPHFDGEPGDPIKGSNAVVPPVTVSVREPGTIHNVNVVATVEPPVTATGELLDPIASLPERVTNDNLDSAGLPWDARIHAGSRERNTDGSWRVRRRPKGVEEAEWGATLARVTAELRDLMEIPVTPGAVADAAAEDREVGDVHHTAHELIDLVVGQFVDIVQGVTVEPTVIEGVGSYTEVEGSVPPPATTVADAVAALNAASPVVVAPPAITPPIAVAPPVAVAPPIATASPAIETFAQVMTFLTARTPKDEAAKPAMVAKVNEILAANGLTVLTQLGQRPDLIPQIMTQFNEAFGE